jgi:hypothetical protein
MLEKQHLAYDATVLRAGHDQRHGRVLGEIVFNAAVVRRQIEDQRHAVLAAEVSALQETISALSEAAGERRAKSRKALDAGYAVFKKLCEANAQLDSADQSALAPLTERSIELQGEMRNITSPRVSEREVQELSSCISTSADLLRNIDKKPSPMESPPLSALARINLAVGLHKPRS